MGLFGSKKKMDDGLLKTRTGFWGNIANTLRGSEIDDDLYEELEEQLVLADTGADTAMELVEALRERVKKQKCKTGEEALGELRAILTDRLSPETEFDLSGRPAVILVIGVNGVGKTTSIAKLANYYKTRAKACCWRRANSWRYGRGARAYPS